MNLWRLEWLRLVRTKRWIALVAVFVFFGFLGPLTARYMGELMEQFGGGIEVTIPETTPADGMTQYTGNVIQLGLLVVILLAAGALAVDSKFEMAVFLRTRLDRASQLLLPRYAMITAATTAAFVLGTLIAWYETVVLIGALPVGGVLLGMLLGALYFAFSVALVAFFGAITGKNMKTILWTFVVLLLMPLLGLFESIAKWLPSSLVGALDGLARGTEASTYWLPALVTVVAIAGLLVLAARSLDQKEL